MKEAILALFIDEKTETDKLLPCLESYRQAAERGFKSKSSDNQYRSLFLNTFSLLGECECPSPNVMGAIGHLASFILSSVTRDIL